MFLARAALNKGISIVLVTQRAFAFIQSYPRNGTAAKVAERCSPRYSLTGKCLDLSSMLYCVPMAESSLFGQQLRTWRRKRGLSQLELSVLAETTPRHVSFIETGRSRPGRELVLRLSESMELPIRARNTLLTTAGLAAEYAERDLNDEGMQPFRRAVEAILERHSPYPACAIDTLGRHQMTNPAFRAFFPGIEKMTPEQAIDAFFDPELSFGRDRIENWVEAAWSYLDRLRHEESRTNHPRLTELIARINHYLKGIDRPRPTDDSSPVMCIRLRIDGQIIPIFSTVMHFENAHDITISDLRVELVFPMDSAGDAYFRSLSKSSK